MPIKNKSIDSINYLGAFGRSRLNTDMYFKLISYVVMDRFELTFVFQLNEITPFIDGTLMYGPGKAWTDAIRELSEDFPGRLKSLDPRTPVQNSFPALNDIRLPMANPPPPREHDLKPIKRFWSKYI